MLVISLLYASVPLDPRGQADVELAGFHRISMDFWSKILRLGPSFSVIVLHSLLEVARMTTCPLVFQQELLPLFEHF